ncbi:MAG: ABC transporter substrate-binding protein [Rhodospirillales bacterium]
MLLPPFPVIACPFSTCPFSTCPFTTRRQSGTSSGLALIAVMSLVFALVTAGDARAQQARPEQQPTEQQPTVQQPTEQQSDSLAPKPLVEQFQNGLLNVMRASKDLTTRQRYDRLLPIVSRTFHLPVMTQIATQGYWQPASGAERDAMVLAFQRMNIATLATLFDGYSGQVFETQGQTPASQGRLVVETRLLNPDGSFVKLAYVAKEISGRWWLIDVVVDDSITELTTRKSEYHPTLESGGLTRLTQLLNEKADVLLKE